MIDFSLRNRFIVSLGALLLVAAGLWAMARLPIDAVPDVTNVQVQVLTAAPALGPDEVEQFITFPVETAMSGMPRIEEIRSLSQFGLSAITVVFEEGTDIYWARQLVGASACSSPRIDPRRHRRIRRWGRSPPAWARSTSSRSVPSQGRKTSRRPYTLMKLRDDPRLERRLPAAQRARRDRGQHLRRRAENLRGADRSRQAAQLPTSRSTAVFEALRQNNGNAGGGYIVHAPASSGSSAARG